MVKNSRGRPRGRIMKKPIQCLFDEETLCQLDYIVAQTGVCKSEVIRQAIKERAQRVKKQIQTEI